MAAIRNKELAALKDSLKHVDSFIAASKGDNRKCGAFNSLGCEPFTDQQKLNMRIYVESWIREPLAAAIDAIEGDRSYSVESYLDAIVRS